MFELIEKLRTKPEKYRRRVAFGASAFITAILFSVWTSVLYPGNQGQILAQQEENPKGDSPIAVIRKSTAQAFDAFKGIWGESERTIIDFQSEYERMRDQVESGQIKIVPEKSQ